MQTGRGRHDPFEPAFLATPPVFLHSMWRTGSSYLLSRFAAEPGYMAFYEPFNGEIGSRRLRTRAVRDYRARLDRLRHPASGDGYFGTYDRADPFSGRPLWSYARPRLALYDVYNGLSEPGAQLLAACIRVAELQGRTAVFGFCHSGIQISDLRTRFGGTHLYLSRSPRDQFLSYSPLGNDFFIAATVLQLIGSRASRSIAIELAPQAAALPAMLAQPIIKGAPHWLAMRLGRRLWRSLTLPEMYALFYLSWIVSNRAGQAHCTSLFSLESLERHPADRSALEQNCAIRLEGLRTSAADPASLELDFGSIEDRVERAVNASRSDRVRLDASSPTKAAELASPIRQPNQRSG